MTIRRGCTLQAGLASSIGLHCRPTGASREHDKGTKEWTTDQLPLYSKPASQAAFAQRSARGYMAEFKASSSGTSPETVMTPLKCRKPRSCPLVTEARESLLCEVVMFGLEESGILQTGKHKALHSAQEVMKQGPKPSGGRCVEGSTASMLQFIQLQ